MDEAQTKLSKKVDLYRDTPVRYLGYANEIGEAFRALVGTKWVLASYGVANLYVLADTVDKCIDVYHKTKGDPNCLKKTAYTATDTLIWQLLASVVVPGFTINRVCAVSNYILKRNKNIPQKQRTWTVIAIGLGTIPFIIKPIDHLIDTLMDMSYRKLAP